MRQFHLSSRRSYSVLSLTCDVDIFDILNKKPSCRTMLINSPVRYSHLPFHSFRRVSSSSSPYFSFLIASCRCGQMIYRCQSADQGIPTDIPFSNSYSLRLAGLARHTYVAAVDDIDLLFRTLNGFMIHIPPQRRRFWHRRRNHQDSHPPPHRLLLHGITSLMPCSLWCTRWPHASRRTLCNRDSYALNSCPPVGTQTTSRASSLLSA